MDGFTYMSMISMIEHREQIARSEARRIRAAKPEGRPYTKLSMTQRPGEPIVLPESRSA